MSEGQFAYSGFTLDELRSLASSPQVGTMQAMPQSFRALAERVGEVADLLSHAQADLPNWWKGPAAEQAAATLGRAAAEAREFHDSALGAATAVGRCAQVVTEQQHQMMNVPDVPEPGITDVVQRPKTPFEALEAARQDASYQAAHEQAVQIVNGIAAQYVETRAHLSTISTPRGENFTSPLTSPKALNNPKDSQSNGSRPEGSITNDRTYSTSQPYDHRTDSPQIKEPATGIELVPAHANQRQRSQAEIDATLTRKSAHPSSLKALDSSKHTTESVTDPLNIPSPQAATASRMTSGAKPEDLAPESVSHKSAGEGTAPPIFDEPYAPWDPTSTRPSYKYPNTLQPADMTAETAHRGFNRFDSQQSSKGAIIGDSLEEPVPAPLYEDRLAASTSPQDPNHPWLDSPSNDNSSTAIIPPYGAVGSSRRAHEERNPRPAYLKERKSVWLPDTIAAPADGIITPDWFKQS